MLYLLYKNIQTISNVDFTAYQNDPSAYKKSIQESAALSIGYGLTFQDIAIVSVSQSASVMSELRAVRSLALSSINAQYLATLVNPAKNGLASANDAVTNMGNNLNAAILNGDFTDALESSADANGATGFSTASSSQPADIADLSPTVNSSSSKNNFLNLSKPSIIALIFMLIIVSISFLSGVFWYFTRKTILVTGLPPFYMRGTSCVAPSYLLLLICTSCALLPYFKCFYTYINLTFNSFSGI